MRSVTLAGGLLALAVGGLATPSAGGKGMIWNGYGLAWIDGAAKEVTTADSPYRYTALSPGSPGKLTVVARTNRGDGRVSRWWYLRGSWLFPAVAYDGTGGGLSADGGTLVLHRFAPAHSSGSTRFAVLDTAVHLRHPDRPGQVRPPHAISRISLPGGFAFDSISPHGSTVYLRRYLPAGRYQRFDTHRGPRFEIRALDTAGGRLLPGAIVNANAPGEPLGGLPISQATSADGRHAYTLYDGGGTPYRGGDQRVPFVEALNTVSGEAFRIDLPGLGRRHDLFMLELRLTDRGRRLAILSGSRRLHGPSRPVISLDVGRIAGNQPTATASASSSATASLRVSVAGRSTEGRPIRLLQLGDSSLGANALVFGCVHGDECAARGLRPLSNGCPDPHSNVFVVPDLNPDGLAAGTRVNGRGVDLNRNFAAGWRPIGSPGDLEYSGSRPFSEPESRLAARLVRRLRPSVTIWFHQHTGPHPLVRAWGQSAPAGRRFARLARIPFHLLPWPDGTAPNWQNHRFRGAGAFVVELPRGALPRDLGSRLERAIVEIARREARVGED
jgi:protein MpaA